MDMADIIMAAMIVIVLGIGIAGKFINLDE